MRKLVPAWRSWWRVGRNAEGLSADRQSTLASARRDRGGRSDRLRPIYPRARISPPGGSSLVATALDLLIAGSGIPIRSRPSFGSRALPSLAERGRVHRPGDRPRRRPDADDSPTTSSSSSLGVMMKRRHLRSTLHPHCRSTTGSMRGFGNVFLRAHANQDRSVGRSPAISGRADP